MSKVNKRRIKQENKTKQKKKRLQNNKPNKTLALNIRITQ